MKNEILKTIIFFTIKNTIMSYDLMQYVSTFTSSTISMSIVDMLMYDSDYM